MDINIDNQLDSYAEVFDFYMNRGQLPPEYEGDVLGEYIKEVIEEPGNREICQNNSSWRDILKTSLLDFVRNLLPYFNAYDRQKKKEDAYIQSFKDANMDEKRRMWKELEEYVSNTYSAIAVNMDGYVYQLQKSENNKEDIFDSMTKDWKNALNKRVENAKKRLLETNKQRFELWVKEAGKEDYEVINKTKQIFFKYPALKEIMTLIGREKEENKEERDETVIKFLPFLVSTNQSLEDIDGIRNGNDIRTIVPSELSFLFDKEAEVLFYQKFASKQLQLFSSKPPVLNREKKKIQKKKQPRLIEGPIIVCIDTSGSMSGKPEQIAKSLLVQILQMAKMKKRKCFLITYAVRSKTLEVSKSQHWREVKNFLKNEFTGGTDGEMMFNDALKALNSQTYSMADVLVISDFCFSYPTESTEHKIKEEQQKGTKFYGIRIGKESKIYDKLFDRIWKI